jgi:hypothetical protein
MDGWMAGPLIMIVHVHVAAANLPLFSLYNYNNNLLNVSSTLLSPFLFRYKKNNAEIKIAHIMLESKIPAN